MQPMKAIAELRGWPHESHRDVREVISQVALENGFDYDRIEAISQAYWIGHENFYENKYSIESLTAMIERVEDVLPYLNQLTAAPPRPFTITSNVQLRRLRRLTDNDRWKSATRPRWASPATTRFPNSNCGRWMRRTDCPALRRTATGGRLFIKSEYYSQRLRQRVPIGE